MAESGSSESPPSAPRRNTKLYVPQYQGPDQLQDRAVHLGQRPPRLGDPRLGVRHDAYEIGCHLRHHRPRSAVGQHDGRQIVLDAEGDLCEEAGNRTSVPDEEPAVPVVELHPEPVRRAGRNVGSLPRRGRRPHLPHGLHAQHPVVPVCQEDRKARQVGHRRPELTGRTHATQVLDLLRQHHVRPGMHGPAAGVRRLRVPRRTAQAERFEHLTPQGVLPRHAPQLFDKRAEEREARVGVVEAAANGMAVGLFAEHIGELRAERARGTLPPGRRRLGRQSTRVREQFGDGRLPHAGTRQMLLQRIPEVQHTLVTQPQDQNSGEGLGDRTDPVLHVRVRRVPHHRGPRPVPHPIPAADHRRDQRRCPSLGLSDGDAVQQRPARGGK